MYSSVSRFQTGTDTISNDAVYNHADHRAKTLISSGYMGNDMTSAVQSSFPTSSNKKKIHAAL